MLTAEFRHGLLTATVTTAEFYLPFYSCYFVGGWCLDIASTWLACARCYIFHHFWLLQFRMHYHLRPGQRWAIFVSKRAYQRLFACSRSFRGRAYVQR